MALSIIVAMDENNGIGRENQLLTHLPNDLKWFKKNTEGHTVIMGRKTYFSLPNGALPNRENIVLSRTLSHLPDAVVVHSLDELWSMLKPENENFIIGGGQIFKLMFPYVDKLYITRIHHYFEADTFFPNFDANEWELLDKIFNPADSKNPYDHTFLIYKRKRKIKDL
jgi:dihydrofolate reductase